MSLITDDEFWAAARAALSKVAADRRAGGRIVSIAPPETAAALRAAAAPRSARSIENVIEDAARVFAHRVRMEHPRFYGFIPSPVSPLSVVGELLTSAYNPHAGSWMQSS